MTAKCRFTYHANLKRCSATFVSVGWFRGSFVYWYRLSLAATLITFLSAGQSLREGGICMYIQDVPKQRRNSLHYEQLTRVFPPHWSKRNVQDHQETHLQQPATLYTHATPYRRVIWQKLRSACHICEPLPCRRHFSVSRYSNSALVHSLTSFVKAITHAWTSSTQPSRVWAPLRKASLHVTPLHKYSQSASSHQDTGSPGWACSIMEQRLL